MKARKSVKKPSAKGGKKAAAKSRAASPRAGSSKKGAKARPATRRSAPAARTASGRKAGRKAVARSTSSKSRSPSVKSRAKGAKAASRTRSKAAARKPASPARRPASRRPASRRTEPAPVGRKAPAVASAVPAVAGVATLTAPAPALRGGPRFPAGDYDYTYLHDFMSQEFVPGNCRAVIFGCGKGEESVFLSERGYRVTGLDSDRNSIGLARERAWLNGRDVDFMIGDVYESATLLPAESFGLASDRGFFRSMDPVKGERERRRFLDLVRRLLLPGGVFLLNATEVQVGRKAKATRRRKKVQNDLLVYEGGEVMGEVIRAGLVIVGRRQYPVAGDAGRADLMLYCRKS